jgi:hypothetical protein
MRKLSVAFYDLMETRRAATILTKCWEIHFLLRGSQKNSLRLISYAIVIAGFTFLSQNSK